VAAEIFEAFNVEPEMNESDTAGAFEVIVDGKKVYSKLKNNRFPEEGEIVPLIEKAFSK
jgi:selT/selW/selH-like putative selenoprotein